MATVKKGDSTYDGVVKVDGKILCEQCKNPEAKCKRGMHMDGRTWFSWQYICECGNIINVKTTRAKDDMMRYV